VKLSDYKYNYFDFSPQETTYTGLADKKIPSSMRSYINSIYWNSYQFKEWRRDEEKERSIFVFEQTQKACEGNYRVKVYSGHIKAKDDQIGDSV
jgi:hypothetical protein